MQTQAPKPFDKLPAIGGERGICISKNHSPTHDDYSETYTKKKGFLSSRTSHRISQNHADTTVGSQLVGDTVTTLSCSVQTLSAPLTPQINLKI